MNTLQTIKKVLRTEADALLKAIIRVDNNYELAVELLYQTRGRVIVSGMGKSGIIGKKISAMLTSTGTPSVFLHPTEALHGDIGIINSDDCVLVLSTSGETSEILRLLNYIKRLGVKLISMLGNTHSSIACVSDVCIDCSVKVEACPIGLVPSASSTLTLAIGDALAIALMEKKGFSEEDFRFFHPGGSIGKKLLKVKHLMHRTEELPLICSASTMTEAVRIIDQKKFGIGIVIDDQNNLLGVLTDGDLRRLLLKGIDFKIVLAVDCMKKKPFTISEDNLAVEALKIMEDHLITALVVTEANVVRGLVHLHDLWRTEMI
jgi:arabinose-5-phosphate isomerase